MIRQHKRLDEITLSYAFLRREQVEAITDQIRSVVTDCIEHYIRDPEERDRAWAEIRERFDELRKGARK